LVLITVLGVYAVPDPPKKSEFADKPMKEKIRDLDLPGAVTGVTALVSLVDSSLTHSL
jgi:hypothetical protein